MYNKKEAWKLTVHEIVRKEKPASQKGVIKERREMRMDSKHDEK